jgi:hypothetical protein
VPLLHFHHYTAPHESMTFARQRLWLGITGVGMTVLFALAAVTFDLPHRLMHPLADQRFASAVASIALLWMLHAGLLLPLDVIGGLVVRRDPPGFGRWFAGWLRGVAVQWLWFALAVSLLLRTRQQFGLTATLLVFLLLQLALLSRQGLLAWLVGGVRLRDPSPVLMDAASIAGLDARRLREVDCDDAAFVGGWTGADARTLWVPRQLVTTLSPGALAAALARRRGVILLGLRRRGVLVAVAWNTLGFALSAGAPHADLVTAAGTGVAICWFTLWTFLGVLLLPTVSRRAVFAADRFARDANDAAMVGEAITTIDRLQDDEAERGRLIETVFHPVPSRASRLRALASTTDSWHADGPGHGAWHAARMMLFLSWSGVGLLSRAVHCNIGRPALWVLLPGD